MTVLCVLSSVQNRNSPSALETLHRAKEEAWKVSEALQTDRPEGRQDFCRACELSGRVSGTLMNEWVEKTVSRQLLGFIPSLTVVRPREQQWEKCSIGCEIKSTCSY